jgi:hypothetical protein
MSKRDTLASIYGSVHDVSIMDSPQTGADLPEGWAGLLKRQLTSKAEGTEQEHK